MNKDLFLALLHNTTLLVATSVVFDLAFFRIRTGRSPARLLMLGIALGLIGIAVMLTPWTFIPGLVFDTRSIVIGIAGLFFGTLPAVVAMVMTGGLRLRLGGAGTVPGIATILMTGTIGLLWRRFRRKPLADITGGELLLFGFVVNGAMLACQLALPPETAVEVLSRISIPVLAIYPAGTALLGALLVGRLRREQTTDALKDALGEKETLLQELQHRVKNSLAMIVSMISLEAGRIEDPGTKTALQDVQGRIIVLSDLYGLLHPGGTTEVRLDLFLRRICGSIQAAFSPGNGSKRDVELVMHFDEFTLDPKRASAVGLILNELLTNAYKYAFPENSGGTVGVTLVRRPREIELIVTDDGPYLPEGFDFSAASGFGLQLVTMLASQLGGGFSWERKDRGTVMKIILPTE